jgi:hypothetical protein
MRRGMASHPGAVAWLTKRVGLPLLPAEVGRSYDEVDFNDIAVAIEAERSVSPIKTCFQWCSKGGTRWRDGRRALVDPLGSAMPNPDTLPFAMATFIEPLQAMFFHPNSTAQQFDAVC